MSFEPRRASRRRIAYAVENALFQWEEGERHRSAEAADATSSAPRTPVWRSCAAGSAGAFTLAELATLRAAPDWATSRPRRLVDRPPDAGTAVDATSPVRDRRRSTSPARAREARTAGTRRRPRVRSSSVVGGLVSPARRDHDPVGLDRDRHGPVAGPVLGVDGVVLDGGVEPQPVALLAVVEGALERLAAAARPAAPAAAPAAPALGVVASSSSAVVRDVLAASLVGLLVARPPPARPRARRPPARRPRRAGRARRR